MFYAYTDNDILHITTSLNYTYPNNLCSFLCPKIKKDATIIEKDVIILEELARILTLKRNINLKRNHNLFKYSFEKDAEAIYVVKKRAKIERRMEEVKKYIKKYFNMIPTKNNDGEKG